MTLYTQLCVFFINAVYIEFFGVPRRILLVNVATQTRGGAGESCNTPPFLTSSKAATEQSSQSPRNYYLRQQALPTVPHGFNDLMVS